MKLNSRIVRAALLSVTVAVAVSAVPAAGVGADAAGTPTKHAILKAIL